MLPEGLLQVSTPGAQQDQLDPLAHHPAMVLVDEIHPLLVVQAAYEAQHGDVGPHWQPQLLHSPVAQWRHSKCSGLQSRHRGVRVSSHFTRFTSRREPQYPEAAEAGSAPACTTGSAQHGDIHMYWQHPGQKHTIY